MDIDVVRKLNGYQPNTEVADALEELLRRMEGEAGLNVIRCAQGWEVYCENEWVEFVTFEGLTESRLHAQAVLFLCDEAEKQAKGA